MAAAPVKAVVLADVVVDAPAPAPAPTPADPAAEPLDAEFLALVTVATVVADPPAAVVIVPFTYEEVTGARTLVPPTPLP